MRHKHPPAPGLNECERRIQIRSGAPASSLSVIQAVVLRIKRNIGESAGNPLIQDLRMIDPGPVVSAVRHVYGSRLEG